MNVFDLVNPNPMSVKELYKSSLRDARNSGVSFTSTAINGYIVTLARNGNSYGVSICSRNDRFDRRVGQYAALMRMTEEDPIFSGNTTFERGSSRFKVYKALKLCWTNAKRSNHPWPRNLSKVMSDL